ncbi:BRO family protein [Paraburkholderia sp. BR14263]|uniref:BRO family protein n=1 Tax=unclassified Paraburkholderia TaxID=2615204 RepID=UPI0034CD1FE4
MPRIRHTPVLGRDARTVTIDGEPWFAARDVAIALDYTRFDTNWKGANPICTLGGDDYPETEYPYAHRCSAVDAHSRARCLPSSDAPKIQGAQPTIQAASP